MALDKKTELQLTIINKIKEIAIFARDNNKDPEQKEIIDDIYRKCILVCDISPDDACYAVGSVLSKYSKKIIEKDYSYFLKSDYSADFKESSNEEGKKNAAALLAPMKIIWENTSELSKSDLHLNLLDIIETYGDYQLYIKMRK